MSQSNSICLPSFIVKIYINASMQTQISLNALSDIDLVLKECIEKHHLKKTAYSFLKAQIQKFMEQNQSCGFNLFGNSSQLQSVNESKNTSFVLRDIKNGDINSNKITIQKTPKNIINDQENKNMFKARKEKPHLNQNSKKIAQKKQESIFLWQSYDDTKKSLSLQKSGLLSKKLSDKKDSLMNSSKSNIFQNKVKQNIDPLSQKKKIKQNLSIRLDVPLKQKNKNIKQFSLTDLQKQLNEQVDYLKYQKKLHLAQGKLCELFHSIIRYNPPKLSKIDPRYATFQGLDQKMVTALHEFMEKLQVDEINYLNFNNFKKLLLKYRVDSILDLIQQN